ACKGRRVLLFDIGWNSCVSGDCWMSRRYVAFLRGVNVGGRTIINMTELKAMFGMMGFNNVKTFLASGNVIFDSDRRSHATLAGEIENTIKKTFKGDIKVLLRDVEALRRSESSHPFKGIRVTATTRLYVTFLPNSCNRTRTRDRAASKSGFSIVRVTPTE